MDRNLSVLIVYVIKQYTNVSSLFSSGEESCAWTQMHALLYLCCVIHCWVVISAVTHCEVSQFDVVSRSVTWIHGSGGKPCIFSTGGGIGQKIYTTLKSGYVFRFSFLIVVALHQTREESSMYVLSSDSSLIILPYWIDPRTNTNFFGTWLVYRLYRDMFLHKCLVPHVLQ
jgi:hypothetical protein